MVCWHIDQCYGHETRRDDLGRECKEKIKNKGPKPQNTATLKNWKEGKEPAADPEKEQSLSEKENWEHGVS